MGRDIFSTEQTSYVARIMLNILYVKYAFAEMLFSTPYNTRIVLF